MTVNVKLEPGDIVRSRRGRDEGQFVIVIALVDERFALVADGDKRRFDQPKRKNVLHLEPLGIRSEEVASSIRDTGRVTNAKLRFAVGQIEQRLVTTDTQVRASLQPDAPETRAEEKGE